MSAKIREDSRAVYCLGRKFFVCHQGLVQTMSLYRAQALASSTRSLGNTMLLLVLEGPNQDSFKEVVDRGVMAPCRLYTWVLEQHGTEGAFAWGGGNQDYWEDFCSPTAPFNLPQYTPEPRVSVSLGRWIWKVKPNHKIYKQCICSWSS